MLSNVTCNGFVVRCWGDWDGIVRECKTYRNTFVAVILEVISVVNGHGGNAGKMSHFDLREHYGRGIFAQ